METLEEYKQKLKTYLDPDLYQILESIDREKYQDRFRAVLREIEIRRNPEILDSEKPTVAPTIKTCKAHGKEATRFCEVCKKGLCPECGATAFEYKTYCDECAKYIEPEEPEERGRPVANPAAARAELSEQLDNYFWSNIFTGIIPFLCIWGLVGRGEAESSQWTPWKVFLMVVLFALPIVSQIYFYLNLRCPKCDSYLLFYFGDGWFEFYRFRHCTRCGFKLRD